MLCDLEEPYARSFPSQLETSCVLLFVLCAHSEDNLFPNLTPPHLGKTTPHHWRTLLSVTTLPICRVYQLWHQPHSNKVQSVCQYILVYQFRVCSRCSLQLPLIGNFFIKKKHLLTGLQFRFKTIHHTNYIIRGATMDKLSNCNNISK